MSRWFARWEVCRGDWWLGVFTKRRQYGHLGGYQHWPPLTPEEAPLNWMEDVQEFHVYVTIPPFGLPILPLHVVRRWPWPREEQPS